MGIHCTLIARTNGGDERRLRLGKSWDALEILLSGGRRVRGGIGDAVTGAGGKACEPEGAFGPSRRLSAARIETIADTLSTLQEATLRERLPLLATLEAHGWVARQDTGIDPAIAQMLREEGFEDDDEDDAVGELLEQVEELTAFYRAAREGGDEVIVSIT